MADEDQNFSVFNSRILVDTVGHVTDEALKASRIKDVIGVLAGRLFNWGQRKSLFPLHLGIKCCALEMAAAGASRFDAERFGVFFRGHCEGLLSWAGLISSWTASLREGPMQPFSVTGELVEDTAQIPLEPQPPASRHEILEAEPFLEAALVDLRGADVLRRGEEKHPAIKSCSQRLPAGKCPERQLEVLGREE